MSDSDYDEDEDYYNQNSSDEETESNEGDLSEEETKEEEQNIYNQKISFSDVERTSSDIGGLITKINKGEFGNKRGKLLERINAMSVTPEERFQILLHQDSREFTDRKLTRFFSIVRNLVLDGHIQDYGRYNPLALVLSLSAITQTESGYTISNERINSINKLLRNVDIIDIPSILRYCRWWLNFLVENRVRLIQ
jgi:hypothetical protein